MALKPYENMFNCTHKINVKFKPHVDTIFYSNLQKSKSLSTPPVDKTTDKQVCGSVR